MPEPTQSPSRTLSQSSRPSMSRPTSLRIPNPDVFSDDYAVDGSPDTSPVDSIQNSSENLPISQPRTSIAIPPSAYTHLSRPSSVSKRMAPDGTSIPHRAVSSVSRSESTAQRTSSTSSRFSMPRAQSPYIGSTGPSHPYAMYPQVTRASSIASESTVRPFDRPFNATASPEHPYTMYPQNTVPEEDDSIPLGFPGMGARYQTRPAGHDIADLVGSDGHVEQLPPYTRYAEHAVPKESPIEGVAAMPVPLSPMSQHSDSGVELNVAAARAAGVQNEKTGWKAKAHHRVCWGLPCWVFLLIVVVIIVATSLGGVIGGVVGNDQGADSVQSATKTIYLDGVPAPTYSPVPSTCPEGQFIIPIANDSRAANTNSCIQNPWYSRAWGCLHPGSSIGFNFAWKSVHGPPVPTVSFDPSYRYVQPNFTYGPQPPNLTGIYPLAPYTDRDDENLGPALYFWTFYTKLTLLPGWALKTPSRERSIFSAELAARDVIYNYPDTWPTIGSEVWSCTFEDTIFEFFVYINQTASADAASTNPTTSCSSSAMSSPYATGSPWTDQSLWSTSTASSGWSDRRRHHFGERDGNPELYPYPRSVKVLEKRKSSNNSVSYCSLMVVQPAPPGQGWSLIPAAGAPYIQVNEVDYEPAAPSGSSRQRRDSPADLQSNCACEYFNF